MKKKKKKFIDEDAEKNRDHCHVSGKFRGAPHWIVTFITFVTFVNLQLTKNVPAIFHNIRGYDSHLIFYEFSL